jgi:hypothetical protein
MEGKCYKDSPYRNIPEELLGDYTLNNSIPVLDWYFDGRNDLMSSVWSDKYINEFKENFSVRNVKENNIKDECYHGASLMLLKAFELHNIRNKKIAVIGSISPWIEVILLQLDNDVTTVEYNVPTLETNQLKCTSYWDFQKSDEKYDCIVTYSSIEHSGLGRYGDPLDPNGDITCMKDIRNHLIDHGILIWGAPVGQDAVVWNAHRIYGKIRLPLIFDGFEEKEWIDHNKEQLINQDLRINSANPVVVLHKV